MAGSITKRAQDKRRSTAYARFDALGENPEQVSEPQDAVCCQCKSPLSCSEVIVHKHEAQTLRAVDNECSIACDLRHVASTTGPSFLGATRFRYRFGTTSIGGKEEPGAQRTDGPLFDSIRLFSS